MELKRGDVVRVDFDPVIGRELAKSRPAVIIQNDIGNEVAPTVIVAAVTSHSPKKATFPFCVAIPAGVAGLDKPSLVTCAHIRTVDKSRIKKCLGHLPDKIMPSLDRALKVSLALR